MTKFSTAGAVSMVSKFDLQAILNRHQQSLYVFRYIALSEHSYQFHKAFDNLSVTIMKVDTELGNQRIRDGKLCQRPASNGELAQTNNSYTKLRNSQDAAGKLSNSNDTFSRHRGPVRTVLE
jgi:hypothetical protein